MSVSNLRDKLEALALFKNCQLFVINEVKFILLQKKKIKILFWAWSKFTYFFSNLNFCLQHFFFAGAFKLQLFRWSKLKSAKDSLCENLPQLCGKMTLWCYRDHSNWWFSLLREAVWCRWLPPCAHVCAGPQQPDWSPSECGVYDGAHGPCSAARRR